jgi:hypothetical protein
MKGSTAKTPFLHKGCIKYTSIIILIAFAVASSLAIIYSTTNME